MNTGLYLLGQKVNKEHLTALVHVVCVGVGGWGWGCSFKVIFGRQIFLIIKVNSMPHHLTPCCLVLDSLLKHI